MSRFFNIAGPCDPERHFMLPAEARLPELLGHVERDEYVGIRSPRQTGKTTAMRAFAARLRSLGYVAVHATLETSQGVDTPGDAEPLWISALTTAAADALPVADRPPALAADAPIGDRLRLWLRGWAQALGGRRLVVLLDEADVVTGPALVSLLHQLRAGFMDRAPDRFPTSVVLVGMRDLRDYLAAAKGEPVNRGSPFNVKAASLTLRGFTESEVAALYAQHTAETGQAFEAAAVARAFEWTQGQPFLVNALARTCVQELVLDRSLPFRALDIDAAKERLVLARTTHLDTLAQRLREPRVAPIIQAVLTGDLPRTIAYDGDDFQYVVDLGLVRRGRDGAEPANPLYREVLARQLTYNLQESLSRPHWRWSRSDGGLDFPALVDAFADWWRENADALVEDVPLYPEAIPHLAFMAFLQRVVNGGGRVTREYAAGRRALDLLVEYGTDCFVVEVKRVRARDGAERIRTEGVRQTLAYLDAVGVREGWLLLFDQRPGLSWDERLWRTELVEGGRTVRIVGL